MSLAVTTVDKSRFRPTPVLRPRRRKMLARVLLVDGHGQSHQVVVENVSSSGVQVLATATPPAIGATVTLHLSAEQQMWGVVRWSEGLRFGVEVDAAAPATSESTEPASGQSMCLSPTRK